MHEIYSNILFKFIECWNQKDMESITSSAIYLVGGFEQCTQSLWASISSSVKSASQSCID